MAVKRGKQMKLYRNTGSYGAPNWSLINNVKDLKRNREKKEWDASTRGSGDYEAIITTMISLGIDFQMVYDPADADVLAIESAFDNDTPIEFALTDGAIATSGTKGIRATCAVTKFNLDEALASGVPIDVTIKPTVADNPPAPFTV